MTIKVVGKVDPTVYTVTCKDTEGGCNAVLEFEYGDAEISNVEDCPSDVYVRCPGCKHDTRLGTGNKEKVLPKYLKAPPSLDRT